MRLLALTGVCVLLAACSCGPLVGDRCGPGYPPCPTGQECSNAQVGGICFKPGASDGGGASNCDGVTCAGWQACTPTLDGGSCEDAVTGVTWVAPASGQRVRPGVLFGLEVTVSGNAGSVPWTSRFASGVLLASGGSFTANTTVPPGTADGGAVLTAGWPDGGPFDDVSIVIDDQPPVLTLQVQGGAPFKRDQQPLALVVANEALDTGTVQVTLDGVAASASATRADCQAVSLDDAACGTAGRCVCARLLLANPPLDGLTKSMSLAVSATDDLGNGPATAATTVDVTRVRWQTTGLGSGADMRASPALDSNGTLYVGTDVGSAGSLYALNPADGGIKWSASVGAVEGLAVGAPGGGPDVVFFASNSGTSAVMNGLTSDAGQPTGAGCLATSSATYSGLGLVAFNVGFGAEVVPVAAFAWDVPGEAYPAAARRIGCTIGGPVAFMATPDVPTSAASATNVAIDDTTAFFIGRGGRLFTSTLSAGTWSAPTSARQGTNNGALFNGSALYRDGATTRLALGGGNNLGDFYFFTPPTSFSAITVGGARVGTPAVQLANTAYAAVDDTTPTLTRFTMSSATAGPTLTSFSAASPALGTGGLGYYVSSDGRLTVFRTGAAFSATPAWTATLPGVTGVVASPSLDCLRDASGAGTASPVGVLYVASGTGTVTAILVDSSKLDPTAEWPKYQRTAGNAGNRDSAFALNPGCP